MSIGKVRRGLSVTAALALPLLFATAGAAQTASPGDNQSNIPQNSVTPESAEQPSGDVVVTGSRIRRPDYDSPSPIVSLDSNTLQQSGTTNITDFLTGYPALVGSSTSSDNSGDRAGIGATGLNLLNLRNLGTQRTLVLVNGRRHVAGLAGSQSIDINTIPTDLIDRVDVLTGGASAIYGADGVTGVVNFVLKNNFEGLTGRAQAGTTTRGDAGQRFLTVTAGKNFADGRGNVALAYEYGKDDRLTVDDRRRFSRANRQIFVLNPDDPENTDPDYAGGADNGIPDRIPLRDIRYAGSTRDGGIDVDFDGVPDFNGDGTPYDPGRPLLGGFQQGGSATPVADYGNDLRPSVERHVVNGLAHFDVSDKLTVYTEGKYARSTSFSVGQPSFDYYLFIEPDNPYIPANLQGIIADAGGALVNRDNFDLGRRGENIRRETYRGVLGARGDISPSLSYDLSYVYGKTKVRSRYVQDVYDDRFYAALDAVRDPATGAITCRVNIQPGWTPNQPFVSFYSDPPIRDVLPPTTFQPGQCVPLNLLGDGVRSQAAFDFVTAQTTDRSSIEQQVVSGSISGDFRDLFSLPGGELGFALGAEYRREKSAFDPDPLAAQRLTFTNALGTTRGKYHVKELFAELNAPLLRDRPFFNTLEFGAAIRYSDYSTIGSTTTWKVDGTYAPIRDLRLRGTYSVAIRAPNIDELFGGASQTFEFFDDPCDTRNQDNGTGTRAANCAAILAATGLTPAQVAAFRDNRSTNIPGFSSGNVALNEEKAKTWTAGAVLQPRFLPGFTLSADWYDIRLRNAINQVGAQQLAELCVDQASIDNQFCSAIQRQQGTGLINGFTVFPQNVAAFETAGLDVNLTWRIPTAKLGTFNIRAVGGYLDKLSFVGTPGADPTDSRGTPFAPKYQANVDLTWASGPLTLNYGLSWFDKTLRYSKLQTAGDPDIVAPEFVYYRERWVHDLYGSVDVSDRFQFYGGVNNVFDRKPDVGSLTYPVEAVGRYVFVGARVKLPRF